MWWQTAVIATLACVLGYMVGHDRGGREMAARVQQGVMNASADFSNAAAECPDSYALARVVGDEVARRLDAVLTVEPAIAVAGADEDPAPAMPPADPQSEAAGARAQTFVDDVLVSGVWVDENRDALHVLMAGLSEAQGSAMMERLMGAMNDGSLSILTSGPPI
jgi:hypothetical protein